MDKIFFDLRVASPGIIQSFDAAKQTVVVQVSIKERIVINGIVEDVTLPLLVDVPVFILSGGGFCVTLPIAVGNECLVIFSDRCIDAWWQSGDVQGQIDMRSHDLSDGFAIIGFQSQPHVVSSYNANSLELRNADATTKITVKANEVEVVAPTVKVTGSTTVNVSGNNTTTIDGKDFLTHKHRYVPGTGTPTNTGGVS